MMRGDNMHTSTMWRGIIIPTILAVLIALCIPHRLHAEAPPAPPLPPATQPNLTAPLLDWSHGQEVYHLAETWLRAGSIETSEKTPPIYVAGPHAIKITLRWLGLQLGKGEASFAQYAPTGATPEQIALGGGVTDLVPMARAAMLQALMDVEDQLQKNHQRTAPAGDAKTGAPRQLKDVVGILQLDLQIAQVPQDIVLKPGAKPETLYSEFAPGFHGLLLQRPTDLDPAKPGEPAKRVIALSFVWPASALATNLSPYQQLAQLLATSGLALDDLKRLGRAPSPAAPLDTTTAAATTGLRLQRFAVIHLVRPDKDSPVTELVRGNIVLPPTSVDTPTLEVMSQRMGQHLLRRLRGDGSFVGTYHPSQDRFDPPTAAADESALALYALARWAEMGTRVARAGGKGSTAVLGEPGAFDALAGVRRAFEVQTGKCLHDTSPDPVTTALLLLVAIDTPGLEENKTQRDALCLQLRQMLDSTGAVRMPPSDPKQKVQSAPLSGQALVLAALAAHYHQTRDTDSEKAVSKLHHWLWEQKELDGAVSAWPWVFQAEVRLGGLLPASANADAARAKRLLRMNAWLTNLRERQISPSAELVPADVIGGIQLRDSDADPTTADPAQPGVAPDRRTAHALATMAMGLRLDSLRSPATIVRQVFDAGLAARFLGQLMFDEPSAFYVRSAPDVRGAVRLSLWDNRLSASPTAMALLATIELRQTLTQLSPPK